jgi:hypothetical protein
VDEHESFIDLPDHRPFIGFRALAFFSVGTASTARVAPFTAVSVEIHWGREQKRAVGKTCLVSAALEVSPPTKTKGLACRFFDSQNHSATARPCDGSRSKDMISTSVSSPINAFRSFDQ